MAGYVAPYHEELVRFQSLQLNSKKVVLQRKFKQGKDGNKTAKLLGIVLASFGIGIQLANHQIVHAEASTTINVKHLSTQKNVNNAKTLRLAFEKAGKIKGKKVINIPKGTYLVNTDTRNQISLPANVVVNAKNVVFKTDDGKALHIDARPTGRGYRGGVKNIVWNGGKFQANGKSNIKISLVHASNVVFKNVTFYKAISQGNHAYDIVGSRNVTIKNNVFQGYASSLHAGIVVSKQHGSVARKEAINIDSANRGAIGVQQETLMNHAYFDGLASYNIKITGNKTLPVLNAKKEMVLYAPSLVGTHAWDKNKQQKKQIPHSIKITNNIINNSAPQAKQYKNISNYTGAIHFPAVYNLTIKNNVFKQTNLKKGKAYHRHAWISLYNSNGQRATKNVTIANNRFIGTKYVKSAIFLLANGHGKIKQVRLEGNRFSGKLIATGNGAGQADYAVKSLRGMNVVAFGDSLTYGQTKNQATRAKQPYIDKAVTTLGGNVTNRGMQGTGLFRGAKSKHNLGAEISKNRALLRHANVVTIGMGTNDYALIDDNKRKHSLPELKKQLAKNIKQIKKLNKNVRIIGILPTNRFNAQGKSLYNSVGKNGFSLNQLSDAYKKIYQKHGVAVLDWRKTNQTVIKKPQQLADRKTHPSQKTYNAMAKVLVKFLNN